MNKQQELKQDWSGDKRVGLVRLLPENSLGIPTGADTDDLQTSGGQHVNYNAANGGAGANHWGINLIAVRFIIFDIFDEYGDYQA